MSIPFPSDEWIKAMMVDLNASQAYEDSARTWEGDFYFIIEPGGELTETVTLYMDSVAWQMPGCLCSDRRDG
jgi:hypothetical protein